MISVVIFTLESIGNLNDDLYFISKNSIYPRSFFEREEGGWFR
jgi:hypothetical protein